MRIETSWIGLLAGLALSGCLTVNGKQVNLLDGLGSGAESTSEASGAAPAGQTYTLDGSAPTPLILRVAAVPTPESSIDRFQQCNNRDAKWLSAEPVAEVVVKDQAKVQIATREPGLMIRPDGTYVCYEGRTASDKPARQVLADTLAPGTYRFYAMSAGRGNTGLTHLELTVVDQVPASASAALAKLPAIAVKEGLSLNPFYVDAPIDASAHSYLSRHLGLECTRDDVHVLPIARIELDHATTLDVVAEHHEVVLRGPDGLCLKGGGEAPKGMYEVYAHRLVDHPSDKVTLALLDSEQPRSFGEAPRVAMGDLRAPLPISAKLGAAEYRWPGVCGEGSREPAFYLDVAQAGQNIALRTLLSNTDSKSPVGWTLYGPLDAAKRDCKKGAEVRWKDPPTGTYAVWATGPTEAKGSPVWAYVRGFFDDPAANDAAGGEALAKLAPVPASPPIEARQVWWTYPYYPRSTDKVEALFLDAPTDLFVFTAANVPGLEGGEALLIERYDPTHSTVIRANGERVKVRTEKLTTKAPAKVALPKSWPDIVKPANLDKAYAIASPTDAPKFAAWESGDAKRTACVGAWMKKNDPTWGKSYELVNLRTGQTLSDQRFAQAEATCGGPALAAAAKRLTTEAYDHRLELRKKVQQALASRF